jgi:hypothetical protein
VWFQQNVDVPVGFLGFQQSPDVIVSINVGNELSGDFGDCFWQRCRVYMTAANGISVEARQRGVLVTPVGSGRVTKKGAGSFVINSMYFDLAPDSAIECPKQVPAAGEVLPHRFLMGHVVGDDIT